MNNVFALVGIVHPTVVCEGNSMVQAAVFLEIAQSYAPNGWSNRGDNQSFARIGGNGYFSEAEGFQGL